MQKTTIIHKYAVAPLLAIAAMHAAVWLGSKNLADFSRAFDVTLGLDALIPLRPEWVVIYVVTFLFWMMGLLFAARQDEELCFRFASGVIIAEIICCVIFIAFPSCITRPELAVSDFFTWALSVVYSFDTPTNCFPSMHCLFAYLVFRQSLRTPDAKTWFKVFCGVCAALICLSTLFVKQHVIADVIGGIFFGELAFALGQKLPVWKIFIKINKKLLQSAP